MISVNNIPLNVTRFPDGASQVWKLDDRQFGRVVDVFWSFESEAEVMHLAQLATLLAERECGTRLEIRCLPYARQDKPIANDLTFALRSFAPMLNAMRWGSVKIHDPHSGVALALIERSVAHYYNAEAAAAYVACSCDMLCFPDAGARQKYSPMFGEMPKTFASKVRDQATGEITGTDIDGDVSGKRVLIVDDLCDGGATFIKLAAVLRERGAAFVALFVSHGLFSKGPQVLFDGGIDRIFVPEREITS